MGRRASLAIVLVLIAACGAFGAEPTPASPDGGTPTNGPDGGGPDSSVPDAGEEAPDVDSGAPALLVPCTSPGVGIEDGFQRDTVDANGELEMTTTNGGQLAAYTGGSPSSLCGNGALQVTTQPGATAWLHRNLEPGVVANDRITWSFALFIKQRSAEPDAEVDIARLSFADSATLTFRIVGSQLSLVLDTPKGAEEHMVTKLVTGGSGVWNTCRVDLVLGPKPRVTVRFGPAANPTIDLFNEALGAPLTKLASQDLGVTRANAKGLIVANYDWNLIYPTK